MADMSISIWLLAFASMAALDIAWALYTRALNKNEPGAASFWAALIHGLGAIAVLSYVDDHRYLSATMLGTIIGTYGVVRWTRKKDSKEEEE